MEESYMDLHEKFSRLQWLLHRHHIQNCAHRGPMADPTRGQGRVLAMLKLQPFISSKDLSYLLGIRQQSLNELLGKLEKSGYITRSPSEADRRIMLISLTEKGKTAEWPDKDFGDIFQCLGEEEQEQFVGYLDRVIASLEEQLGDDNEEERYRWIRGARDRMGDEWFERIAAMRGGLQFGGCYGGGRTPPPPRGPQGEDGE